MARTKHIKVEQVREAVYAAINEPGAEIEIADTYGDWVRYRWNGKRLSIEQEKSFTTASTMAEAVRLSVTKDTCKIKGEWFELPWFEVSVTPFGELVDAATGDVLVEYEPFLTEDERGDVLAYAVDVMQLTEGCSVDVTVASGGEWDMNGIVRLCWATGGGSLWVQMKETLRQYGQVSWFIPRDTQIDVEAAYERVRGEA